MDHPLQARCEPRSTARHNARVGSVECRGCNGRGYRRPEDCGGPYRCGGANSAEKFWAQLDAGHLVAPVAHGIWQVLGNNLRARGG